MTEEDRLRAVRHLAANPTDGDLIVGSGGIRKVRIAGRNKGKSGGFRIATAYLNADRPVYLVWVLSKGQTANFTAEQVKAMKAIMDRLRKLPGTRE